MSKFAGHTYTITMSPWGTVNHRWELRGPNGGIHFHVGINRESQYPPSAGLEIHRCEPADYQQGEDPHHINCPVTGGRCWHDGTSLYATETLWPMFEMWLKDGNHKFIFRSLEEEYEDRFSLRPDGGA